MWRIKTMFVVLIVGVLLVACGGEGKSDPTEEGLRQRAEAAAELASSANQKDHPFDIWEDIYGYLTPEYRDRCGPSEEFGLQVHFNLTDLAGDGVRDGSLVLDGAVVSKEDQGSAGLIVVQDGAMMNGTVLAEYVTGLNYQVSEVIIDRNKGQVGMTVTHEGQPVTIGRDEAPENWLYEDGQWFLESSKYWMDSMERSGGGCQYGRIPGIPIFE